MDRARISIFNTLQRANNLAIQQISTKFDDDIANMEKNLKGADNSTDRKEFEQTLESLKARKTQLKSVGTLLSRFEAQLTGTNNTIDSVVTGIVSLQGRSSKESPPCSKRSGPSRTN